MHEANYYGPMWEGCEGWTVTASPPPTSPLTLHATFADKPQGEEPQTASRRPALAMATHTNRFTTARFPRGGGADGHQTGFRAFPSAIGPGGPGGPDSHGRQQQRAPAEARVGRPARRARVRSAMPSHSPSAHRRPQAGAGPQANQLFSNRPAVDQRARCFRAPAAVRSGVAGSR